MEILWDSYSQSEWTTALDVAGAAPLQQSWAYGNGLAALGALVRRAVIYDGGVPMALVQITERSGLRLLSRGPVWLSPVSPETRRAALRLLAWRLGMTIATPAEPVAGTGMVPLITQRYQALWQLGPDPSTLRANLNGKWRGHLAQAERRGLRLIKGNDTTLATLLAAETAQRQTRGYRALPARFALGWPPDQRQVWSWSDGQGMQAAMLFLRHGTWATYHHGWTSTAGRAVFAHGPMLWQAMLSLRDQGVMTLDLGTLDAANPGLANFKAGTGATVTPLGATCWVLPG